MSQNLHFYRIKLFDTQDVKQVEYDDVIEMLRAYLKREPSNYEKFENFLIESIDIDNTYSAYNPKLEPLIQTGSPHQIDQKLSYYFVTQELWEALDEIISEHTKSESERSIKSSSKKNSGASPTPSKSTHASKASDESYSKDRSVLHNFYTQKILVFNVS